LVNDPRLVIEQYSIADPDICSCLQILAAICPFCGLLGYLTPRLIDNYSGGNPVAAGKAYAINVVGCILGPLFACYLLLPFISERHALTLLALPLLFLWLTWTGLRFTRGNLLKGLLLAVVAGGYLFSEDFEKFMSQTNQRTVVRRDYAAAVISCQDHTNKLLLVNGFDMTRMTPITKFMVHLPLAFEKKRPESALVICFGMGPSFRSALSWDIDTTAVELVPSVPKAFGFYHADAAQYVS